MAPSAAALAAADGARVPCAACAAAAVTPAAFAKWPQLSCMRVERLRRQGVRGTCLAARGGGGSGGARSGAGREAW